MKKLIILLLLTFTIVATHAQSFITLNAYQKSGVINKDSTQTINTDNINLLYSVGSKTYFQHADFQVRQRQDYTIRESVDTIVARTNKIKPTFIALHRAMKVGATDSFATYYYNINSIIKSVNGATTNFSWSKSKVYYKEYFGTIVIPVVETSERVYAIIDSIEAIKSDIALTTIDTANYTQKYLDEHIILNSTTADTLTLLNPSLFAGKNPLVIANIGSGAYTLAGGFTVKDKSGSTVSSLTANTVYTFKAYYNGSAYIWLKEY